MHSMQGAERDPVPLGQQHPLQQQNAWQGRRVGKGGEGGGGVGGVILHCFCMVAAARSLYLCDLSELTLCSADG